MREIIYPNGETMPFECTGEYPTLEELQKAVDGYIEMVTLNDGRVMIINEEGKLKGLELNPVATEMFAPGYDVIVGNAIVMKREELEPSE